MASCHWFAAGRRSVTKRSILITGCSSGIGYACAHGLAEHGWRVIASCRDPNDVARLRAEGLSCVELDLEDEASIEHGFAAAMALTDGRLDALFNNGAYAVPGAVEDLPTAALRASFEANFFGWHRLTQLSLKVMRVQGHGRIVQNSSVYGFCASPIRGAYIAAKHAIEGLTDSLRHELHGSGIYVSIIEPGPIKTRIRENSSPHYDKWVRPNKAHSAFSALYEEKLEPRLAETDTEAQGGLPPEACLKRVIHAIESPRPCIRYRITWQTHLAFFLKRFAPVRFCDILLRRT